MILYGPSLLSVHGDLYQRAYKTIDTQCPSFTSVFHLSLYIPMAIFYTYMDTNKCQQITQFTHVSVNFYSWLEFRYVNLFTFYSFVRSLFTFVIFTRTFPRDMIHFWLFNHTWIEFYWVVRKVISFFPNRGLLYFFTAKPHNHYIFWQLI